MMAESAREREVRQKAAEIAEGHRSKGEHEKADKTASSAEEVIKGIKKEEGN